MEEEIPEDEKLYDMFLIKTKREIEEILYDYNNLSVKNKKRVQTYIINFSHDILVKFDKYINSTIE